MFEAEDRALRESAAVRRIDGGRGRLVVRGADRTSWLHNLTTNDIRRLAPDRQGCFATMVTRIGKLVATLTARAHAEELRVDTDRPGPLREAMEKLIVMEDVRLEEATARTQLVGVYGPRAAEMLGLAADLPPWGVAGAAMRVPVPVDGFELWLPAEDPTFDALRERGAVPIGEQAWEVARIEACFPRWGAELDETVIPVEANLESIAISYSKGCYVGQEIIQRIKTYGQAKRQLRLLRFEGDRPPAPGDAILRDGAEVGRVTSAAVSPRLGPVALGYLARGHDAVGTRVVVGEKVGQVSQA
jgi:folate-binding protein YgfZ